MSLAVEGTSEGHLLLFADGSHRDAFHVDVGCQSCVGIRRGGCHRPRPPQQVVSAGQIIVSVRFRLQVVGLWFTALSTEAIRIGVLTRCTFLHWKSNFSGRHCQHLSGNHSQT